MSTSEDFTLTCAVTPDRQNLVRSTFFTATVSPAYIKYNKESGLLSRGGVFSCDNLKQTYFR